MATGKSKPTSILDTPLPQSVLWRLLSPLSPIDSRQRKLVDSDLQCHATSAPCEADNGNGRVYDRWNINTHIHERMPEFTLEQIKYQRAPHDVSYK